MHITLTGNLGSGKSTICKLLNEKYGYETYSTGKVQRQLAAEHNMSVLEMNRLMCSDKKYDNMIDDAVTRISRENQDKKLIFDSRLAWNFVDRSFKVFLSVSLDEAAKRVWNDCRGEVEKYTSLEDAREQLRQRAETENVRYHEIYGLDYFNFSNYNLVLDSTNSSPELIARVLMSEFHRSMENGGADSTTRILMSPARLGVNQKNISDCENAVYDESVIKIRKTKRDFEVIEGLDILNNAAMNGAAFVAVELAD